MNKTISKIARLLFIVIVGALGIEKVKAQSQSEPTPVDHFEKIIVSPHIKVSLKEGDEETVRIMDRKVPSEKVHIGVEDKTLWIYLEDAKVTTKHVKKRENGVKRSVPVYRGTQLTVDITYKTIEELSIRGEEDIVSKGRLKADKFNLKMYGESSLLIEDMEIAELNATFYGENHFKIEKGSASEQAFKTYGDCVIDAQDSENRSTRITSYGSSEFYINAGERIKVWAFGDANIHYKGEPEIEKTISIGEINIQPIDQ